MIVSKKDKSCTLQRLWNTFQYEKDSIAFQLPDWLVQKSTYLHLLALNTPGSIKKQAFKSLSDLQSFKNCSVKGIMRSIKHSLYIKVKLQYPTQINIHL